MTNRNCPGQDLRYWKPEDIYEEPCPNCGGRIEFFKDDLRRKCPHCGQYAVNPRNDMACAAWCKHAKECLEQLGRIPSEEECASVMLNSIQHRSTDPESSSG